MVYDDGVELFSDTGIPCEASITEEIETAREILGATRDIAFSEVADWSFAREIRRQKSVDELGNKSEA
jgi:hypothetical protein